MVFVVVPAYNEENKIGRVIRDLFSHGWDRVVVVDDGSSDNTARVARLAGAMVLVHEVNRGQGASLQTGNEYALRRGAEIIVHFDADGQMNPADIKPAVDKLRQNNLDVILGSRFLGNTSQLPWTKKCIVLPISRFINNIFSGLRLTDVHNGFRVLSRRAAEKIVISQDGMAHNSEIPAQIKKLKLNFAEYPVDIKYEEYGQGIRGGFKIIFDLFLNAFLK